MMETSMNARKPLNHSLRIALILTLAMSMTACLKTRAQLKNDAPEEDAAPVPVQVQDVQPQNQYVIDEIKSEITRLTGRIEDLERKAQQTADTPKADKDLKAMETRIVELEQAQAAMLETLKKMQASIPMPENVGAFERGKEAFKAGEYEQAVEHFTEYLKASKGKHIEEATFKRAESHFKLKQYKKAIVDYSKFPEKYTKSSKLAQALYQIGQSFDALGMKEDGKGFYQELVDKFPKSPEAKKARPKLK